MRWIACRTCHGFIPQDQAAIDSDAADPEKLWVCTCPVQVTEKGRAPAVFGDLAPYVNIIDGKVIDGRREHKEFLRRHGVEENPEPPAKLKERLYEAKHGAKHG